MRAAVWRTAGFLLAALLVGCGDSGDPGEPPAGSGDDPPAATPEDEEEPAGTLGDHLVANSWQGSVDLDLVATDAATDVIVRLTGVSFDGEVVFLDLQARNPASYPILLAAGSGSGTFLADDLDRTYRFVPPDENRELRLDPDEELEGRLAFRGPVPREATRLELRINHAAAGPYPVTEWPSFVLELPLPAEG
jgi:hypothetical protein